MQHPSLIERSVGATLRAFTNGKVTPEEAELDLVELIASQIVGKTDYAVAVIGFYVRAVLKAVSHRRIDPTEAFETFVEAAIGAGEDREPVSLRLAQPFAKARSTGDGDRSFA